MQANCIQVQVPCTSPTSKSCCMKAPKNGGSPDLPHHRPELLRCGNSSKGLSFNDSHYKGPRQALLLLKAVPGYSSTGEFPSMTLDEREHVAEVARNTWPGRQVVNISCCNVEDTVRLLKHAQHGRGSPKVKAPFSAISCCPRA